MAKYAVIVESPTKAKKIQKYLGDDYKVVASFGHIRDLPPKEIGVTPEGVLHYELKEKGKKTFSQLKALAAEVGSANVYLASDPDREGEAISWHLSSLLKLNNPKRVKFHEITKTAILDALQNAGLIDMDLVHAYEARRGIDRLVGWKVSFPLSDFLGKQGLSAGRVQIPAVALLVERERKIRSHQKRQHYKSELAFFGDNPWVAKWVIPEQQRPEKVINNSTLDYYETGNYCFDRSLAEAAAACKQVLVKDYQAFPVERKPLPPLITTSLIQVGSQVFGYDPDQVMNAAQKLFEEGHITYHRTDEPNLASEAIEEIRRLASENNFPLPATPHRWQSAANAQEAHEAIRPVDIRLAEAGDDEIQRSLYGIIRDRAFMSQLASATYHKQVITLQDLQGRFTYQAQGRVLKDPGFLSYNKPELLEDEEDPDAEHDDEILPVLQPGLMLTVGEGEVIPHETTPPPRYTVDTLVKKLESLSIGRPSTYATLFDVLKARGYYSKDKRKKLLPTSTAEEVYDALYPAFQFAHLTFTRELEQQLDSIAGGKQVHRPLIVQVGQRLDAELTHLTGSKPQNGASEQHGPATRTPVMPDKTCTKCGKPMRFFDKGKYGPFYGCTGFADKSCSHTEKAG